jgi:hypothetical protein
MLKALGLSGTPVQGQMLVDRTDMEEAEFLDTLAGLMTQGYVLSSKVNVVKMEDVERSWFRVDSACSRELRSALRPGRRRDQERVRRRRG